MASFPIQSDLTGKAIPMAVRQDVHIALDILAHVGDPDAIEVYLVKYPKLAITLDSVVHQDECPPIRTGLPQEHISRKHHGNFIQQAAIAGAPVPFRRP